MIAQSYTTGDILFRATDEGPDVWRMFEDEQSLYTQSLTTNRTVVTVKDNGNVGIGTTSPASRLEVGGGCITGSFCSDERLKKDILPLDARTSFLDKVMRLRPVSFSWRQDGAGKRNIGLIAQDVERILPEVVTRPDDGRDQMGLSCTGLDAVLVQAIKAQQDVIDTQRGEMALLRRKAEAQDRRLGELGALERRLQTLEARLAKLGR